MVPPTDTLTLQAMGLYLAISWAILEYVLGGLSRRKGRSRALGIGAWTSIVPDDHDLAPTGRGSDRRLKPLFDETVSETRRLYPAESGSNSADET
ncbi:MAG: hypothetical protein CM15mP74_21690 [Halieaceae bacterium]|nr:MAG: hypothetical protein CM15mP74_21690 [Halieaceae bacterium]